MTKTASLDRKPGRRVRRGLAALAALALTGAAWAQDAGAPAGKPSLDPFLTLIVKPKPKAPPPRRPTTFRPPAPSRPRIPQLVAKVVAMIGGADEHMAVIEYKGEEYVVSKGWDGTDEGSDSWDNRFRVVEVDEEKVVVYDTLAKQRRSLRPDFGDEEEETGF